MNISFDLHGVLTEDGTKWKYKLLRYLNVENSFLEELVNDIFDHMKPKLNPYLFLGDRDTGYIVTSCKPYGQHTMLQWLQRHGIFLPVFWVDADDTIDWANLSYEAASIEAAKRKYEVIKNQIIIDVHFDNNPIIVEYLRREGIPTILVS